MLGRVGLKSAFRGWFVRTPEKALAPELDTANLKVEAEAFRSILIAAKCALQAKCIEWYPYDSLSNFAVLDAIATKPYRDLNKMCNGSAILDLGCADGATSFLLASLGLEIDAVDYPATNFNGMKGVRELQNYFQTKVNICAIDLDSQFDLPRQNYGLVFFLGLLYHLKNPFYTLEKLSGSARFCFLSTRIAKFDATKSHELESIAVAYLVSPTETNNDPTNYWIFSRTGLLRLLERTGWEVRCWKQLGNTVDSDPASHAGDERAFCLLESKRR